MPIDASAITLASDSVSGLTNREMGMATPLAQTKSFKPAFARLLASFFGSAATTANEGPLPLNQSPVKPGMKQQATVVANDTPANHNAATIEPTSLAQLILPFQTCELPTNSWTAPSLEGNVASSDTTAVQQGLVRVGMLSVPESAFGGIQGSATATGTALGSVYTTTTAPMAGTPSLLPAQANSGAPIERQASEDHEQAPSTASVQASPIPLVVADRSMASPKSAALGSLEPRAIPIGDPGSTSADSLLPADSFPLGTPKQGPATSSRNIVSENPAPKSFPDTSADPVSGATNRGSLSLRLDPPSSMEIPPSPAGANPTTNAVEFSQLLSNLADQVSAVIISHTLPDVIPGLTEEYGIRTSQAATSEALPAPTPATITLSTAPAPETQGESAGLPLPIGSAAAEPPLQDGGGSTVDAADPSSQFATGTLRSTAASSQLQSSPRGSNRLTQKATTAEIVTPPSDQPTARTTSPTTTGTRPAGSDAGGPASSDQAAEPDSKLPVSIAPAVFVGEHLPTKDSSALAGGAQTPAAQQSPSQSNASPSADSSRASNAAKYSSAPSGDSPNPPMGDLAAAAQATSIGATPRPESAASINTLPNTTSGGSNEAPALASVVAHRVAEPVELSPAMQAWNGGENLPSRLIQAARLGGNLREAEMNIAMQSESLGAVDMRARVSGDVVGATIGVERHDAHAVISNDLYALHQALEERQLRVGNVTIVQHGSITSDTTANDGERPRQQRGTNPPVPFDGDSNGGQPAVSSAAVETVESLAMRMIFDSQGRLSVRA